MKSFEVLRNVIRDRVTSKMLGKVGQPLTHSPSQRKNYDAIVLEAIEHSGWAPFHYDRNHHGVAEPWRVHWLNQDDCHRLASDLPSLVDDLKPGNKMPQLLSGCGSLALFNWLPVAESAGDKWENINREHLAATAAVVQNFLLLLTAAGLPSYWSSGGVLSKAPFEHLGINPDEEKLLAAVFIHYPDGQGDVERLWGKQRARRSPAQKWFSIAKYPQ